MPETNKLCYVNLQLYEHLFLIPAVVILAILAFLNKRKNYRRDILSGRPGLVIPFDFLGFDDNRFAVAAIFGASTKLVIQAIQSEASVTSTNNWGKAFEIIGKCLEVACLCYPLFACLTTTYKVVGSMLGFLYTLSWSVVFFIVKISSKCQGDDSISSVLTYIPGILCYFFILGKYLSVLVFERKNLLSRGAWSELDIQGDQEGSKIANPWLINHVKQLLCRRIPRIVEKKSFRCLRIIYNWEKNFRFSVETLSVVVICSITLYSLFVGLVTVALSFSVDPDTELPLGCKTGIYKISQVSVLLAGVIVTIISIVSLVRFMDCHKSNMLRIFKGDTSFIPAALSRSQFMVVLWYFWWSWQKAGTGKCLKYAGFQIAYFVWGITLAGLIIVLITGAVVIMFDCSFLWDYVKGKLVYGVSFWIVAVVVWILIMVSSLTLFRDKSYEKNVIALENRNLYLVFSYFFFFLALPMGFFAAILRVLKAMMIGFFMLSRIDCSVLPEGFQRFDKGYSAYISYLYVLAAHRNPVLRVFCQVIADETKKPGDRNTCKRYRNKWFLLVTLLRNPQLQVLRKHVILPPNVIFINTDDLPMVLVDS